MSQITVSTKNGLKRAKDKGYDTIIVKGELAKKLYKTRNLTKLSKSKIAIITGILATVPLTGGISGFAAAPIAAAAGVKVAVIIAIAAIGITLVLGVLKEYEMIEGEIEGLGKVKLKRK